MQISVLMCLTNVSHLRILKLKSLSILIYSSWNCVYFDANIVYVIQQLKGLNYVVSIKINISSEYFIFFILLKEYFEKISIFPLLFIPISTQKLKELRYLKIMEFNTSEWYFQLVLILFDNYFEIMEKVVFFCKDSNFTLNQIFISNNFRGWIVCQCIISDFIIYFVDYSSILYSWLYTTCL